MQHYRTCMTRTIRFIDTATGYYRDLPPSAPTASARSLVQAIASADGSPLALPYPGDHAITATISGHCLWGALLTDGATVARFGIALRSRCGSRLWSQMHAGQAYTAPLVEPWAALSPERTAPPWAADFCMALATAWQAVRREKNMKKSLTSPASVLY